MPSVSNLREEGAGTSLVYGGGVGRVGLTATSGRDSQAHRQRAGVGRKGYLGA